MGKWYRISTVVIAAAIVLSALAACGTGSGGGTTIKALKIATEFPVSGGDAADTVPAQNGVDLAVKQNATLSNGYTLSVVHKDDEGANGADPSIGATNVQSLLNDQSVMGIVGPFNSGVAIAEIPLVNAGGIVEISPTNTNPGLTLSQYASQYSINFSHLHPSGDKEYYFRIPANDVTQGKVDAEFALQTLGAKTAFIVDDNTAYGKGLADFFTTTFTSEGGSTVGTRTSIQQSQVANLGALATTIKSANPDVVFYGGVTSQGGAALKLDLTQGGFSHPMVGGDGIADDPGFIQTAGHGAIGTYGTVAAPDVSSLTSSAAQTFATAYKAQFPGAALLPYSAQAYDAAMIEITAIKNLIAAGKDVTRANIRDAVAGINYPGVTGTISFDANGDNSGQKVFSVYQVDQTDKWVYLKQVVA